jgi:hypothetical protein
MFGTEPLFRDHTKGLYAQVGRALYWASADVAAGRAAPRGAVPAANAH